MRIPGPDRHRIELATIAFAAIVVAGIGIGYVRDAEAVARRQPPSAATLTADSSSANNSIGMRPSGRILAPRDPFRALRTVPTHVASAPARQTPTARQAWVVSSILFKDSTRTAIVNDSWVEVGDRITGGGTVAAIERKFVVITDAAGRRHVLPLKEGEL